MEVIGNTTARNLKTNLVRNIHVPFNRPSVVGSVLQTVYLFSHLFDSFNHRITAVWTLFMDGNQFQKQKRKNQTTKNSYLGRGL